MDARHFGGRTRIGTSVSTRVRQTLFLSFGLLLLGCGGGGGNESDTGADAIRLEDAAGDTGSRDAAVPADGEDGGAGDLGREDVAQAPVEVPWTASAAYEARRNEYLRSCLDATGPGQGSVYGQSCRVFVGETALHEEEIEAACQKLDDRQDTADFRAAGLLRLLYLDDATGALSAATRTRIEGSLKGFKYWIDEPGQDRMCYWTENHQILYHSAELLVGQRFPDLVFPNAGMTGAEHVAHAKPLLERWFHFRGRIGFSEWHSNVYFNEDIPALLNLVDFAEDEEIRTKAAMVLDLLAFDLLNNTYRAMLATVQGRTYPSHFLDGCTTSTQDAAYIMVGIGSSRGGSGFSGSFLATSSYAAPPLLEEVAAATVARHEHRQRDSIDVEDGPEWGLSYEGLEDMIFWSGLEAIGAPEVIEGTMAVVEDYDLWDGFLFGDLPDEFESLLRMAVGTPSLRGLSEELEVLSRGIVLGSMSTYTYRTPYYQMSGAQSYRPGWFGAQTLPWQATIDERAFVFTSFPSGFDSEGFGLAFGGEWIGSWFPRVTLARNVAVVQYRTPAVPAFLTTYLEPKYTHAYFPRDHFDELREEGHWTIGRKGDAFLALYSQVPTRWADEPSYDLIADGTANVWIAELGSIEEHASFEAFVTAITAAEVAAGETVTYASPTIGAVEVGWEGPMTVDGAEVDLGPYSRWDNAYSHTEFGSALTRVEKDGLALELDFDAGTRRLLRRGQPRIDRARARPPRAPDRAGRLP